jgi:hypothetical protein
VGQKEADNIDLVCQNGKMQRSPVVVIRDID